MQEKITYRSERVFCGKKSCQRCREGRGHGPYWYAYQTVNGKRKKSYVGLHLPEGVHVAPKSPSPHIGRVNQNSFVGRDAERSLLSAILLKAERGESALLILTGDAGIGKTRLAEEAGREAKKRGWAVAWTRAYAQESGIPYRMWVESLRKVMTQGLWQRQEIARRPLIYQSLGTLLPELQDLLPQDALIQASPPEQEQLRLWDAVRALLATISESTPLFIVLDDLQWADSSSCELLAYLVRQLRGQPVMIVGTCRDIDLPPNHPLRSVLVDLQREQAAQTLTIKPLTDEQIRALISHLPEPMVRDIQVRAAGNPFFAEELARFVETQTMLPDRLELSSAGSPAPTPSAHPSTLPDTISAVLDQHVSKISTSCQRLLARAAVLGGSFEFNTILAMEVGGPDASEDIILDLLEEALQAGMLTEEGSGMRITYHFWHPLLVSHLYDGLSAGRRASLHRRAAEVLREMYQGHEQEGAPAIVYHLVNGGAESPQIAYYAELAADRAYTLSAYPEAERHYRLAAQHIETLPANASPDECLRLANLLERLGECMRFQGNEAEARRLYQQVLEVRPPLGSTAPPVEWQQESELQALLWCAIGQTWYNAGNDQQAGQCYECAERILQRAGVAAGPAWASLRFEQGYLYWREGNYEEAQRAAQEALRLFEAVLAQKQGTAAQLTPLTRMHRTLAGDPVDLGRTHVLLGIIANAVGRPADTSDHWNTALLIFERYDCQREIAILCCDLGDLYIKRSDYARAQAAFGRSRDLAERVGDIPLLSVVLGNMGILAARTGFLVEAESWYRQSLVLAEKANVPAYVSTWQIYLASVLLDQGKLAEARACLHDALATSRRVRNTPCIGLALVILGQMRVAQALMANSGQHATRLLLRGRKTLERALTLEELEAEVRTEGHITLGQIALLCGEVDDAQKLALATLEEARRYELNALTAHTHRLLGCVLAAKAQHEEADRHFEQALALFRACAMRTAYARTLHHYGEVLLKRDGAGGKHYQQGVSYLKEAQQLFTACQAILDKQLVERRLASMTTTTPEE